MGGSNVIVRDFNNGWGQIAGSFALPNRHPVQYFGREQHVSTRSSLWSAIHKRGRVFVCRVKYTQLSYVKNIRQTGQVPDNNFDIAIITLTTEERPCLFGLKALTKLNAAFNK